MSSTTVSEPDYAAQIAAFASSVQRRAGESEVMQAMRTRLVDTVGCLRGAMQEDAVVRARATATRFAATSPDSAGASVAGSGERLTVEAAAFVNGVAARYLDFNDIYLSKEAVHPSDNIPAGLALAEAIGATGKELLTALATGYEVHCRLADSVSTRAGRWDNVILGAIASSVMAGGLLQLNPAQQVHAINIAASGNTALMQTRVGSLSMWKAAAAAYAGRAGLFAALSASGGMTGPPLALNGSHGLFSQVTGSPAAGAFDAPVDAFHLLGTHLKAWSSQYFTQTAISAALEIRNKIDVEEIQRVSVSTFEFGRVAAADGPDKWRPRTRETADHSMPYCVAVALRDGAVTVSSFDEDRLGRPDIAKLLARIEVKEDPAFTASYPKKVPTGIAVKLTDGSEVGVVVEFPLGHSANPMSQRQIADKFLDLTGASESMKRLLADLDDMESFDGKATAQLIRRAVCA